ncbi:hypothetical protein [Mesorhizobium sp.]|uniref:hypothetical protein n=1 Tax=Mesorhizobium sp. TaxID=1871066 RepID=UPI00121FD794|nr:hypothetical protein [Mesorhizobium sp.]TIL54353.1 MAG: hypothetical protein E5Y83_02615 [Mesorhizobium sp.]TIT24441.1 MAG: hypothetical protein E5W70_03810 [Mesorhizobium sp.]
MKKIRDAQTIIGMLEGGEVAAAMSTEITETLAKLKELSGDRPKTKIKGHVSLKINVEVEAGTATITCEIDSKRPKPARGSSFYWVLDDGSLSTEHPQQTDMFAGPRAAADRQ